MTSKALYTAAKRWYLDDFKNSDTTLDTSNEISRNECANTSASDDVNTIRFTVVLAPDVWNTIAPNEVTYHRNTDDTHNIKQRKELVLKPGVWTDVLVDRIAHNSKNIICEISFKRGKVTPNGQNFAKVIGKCVVCDASLIGVLETQPKLDEDVKFLFEMTGYDEKRHRETEKKVKVTGSKAKSLATSSKPAIVLHREMSAKSGEMFTKAKGRVPTANAIRNMQSRNRQKSHITNDPYLSLQLIKAAPNYKDYIHSIGIAPFSLIYGSPKQFQLYDMYTKRNKITKMSSDATGGLIRKLRKCWLFFE